MAGPVKVGRYLLFEPFAMGGTAQVHFGRLVGAAGFSRTFAVKRLHPHLAGDPEFTTMLLDEARLAARIRHPSVVPVFEVLQVAGELLLVMEYVPGASVARLNKLARAKGERVPLPIAVAIVLDALAGLDAAHQAESEAGKPLEIVHRDVSPQNIMVGTDGLARLVDFGIAHATERLQLTRTGEVKGKLEYLAPEQVRRSSIDRRTDVYAASVVLWELLAGRRLHELDAGALSGAVSRDLEILRRICNGVDEPPSAHNPEVSRQLDQLVSSGLSLDASHRPSSAGAMAAALESVAERAQPADVAAWLRSLAGAQLERESRRLAQIEAYVPNGSEPSADAVVAGGLDELLEAAGLSAARSRPAEPLPVPAPEAPAIAMESETLKAPTPPTPPSPPSSPQPSRPAKLLGDPRARLIAASVGAAATLGSVIVIIALVRSCGGAEPPAVVAVERSGLAPTPSAIPPEPAAAATTDPPAAPAATATSTATATPAATALPVATTARRSSKAASKPGCNPPYRLDADGVRIPKRECFR